MVAKLVAEEGILKDHILSFEEGEEWIIGRDPDSCQLIIEDPAASRRHLICRKTPDGIEIENLSTTNPILINDGSIKEPKLLSHGDTVRIGSCLYRFYEEEAHVFPEEEVKQEIEEKVLPESVEETPQEIENQVPEEPKQEEPPMPVAEPPIEETPPPAISEEPSRDSIFEEAEGKPLPELATINFNISETGRWLLKVVAGPNSGAEFVMQPGHSYLIGTDPNSCDIVFHDNSVSRQHARLSLASDNGVFLEDLNSRNGTLIDGEKLEGKRSLEPNIVATLGTTSFVIFDREGEMQTIISPLLPSIVKTLQTEKSEEEKKEEEKKEAEKIVEEKKTHFHINVGAFILIAILTGVFGLAAIGITLLFTGNEMPVKEEVNTDKVIRQTLAPFPEVRYQFNKSTGKLILLGHVLTSSDKTRLLAIAQEIPFVRQVDDHNVIIDEFIWREINLVLARDPAWKGIAIHSPRPGQFVISGYLQSRTQSERLWNYLNGNFPYLDLLENKVVVEEELLQSVNTHLESLRFNKVLASMNNGELTLAGTVPVGEADALNEYIEELKATPGLRNVRTFVTEAAPEASVVNISDRYEVSGFSHKGNVNVGVVINGRILSVGDKLDNMRITEIGKNYVLLTKDGVVYRIDYTR